MTKKTVCIVWDFDLTLTSEYQQMPLFRHREAQIALRLQQEGFNPTVLENYFHIANKVSQDQGLAYLQSMLIDATQGRCLEGLTNTELFETGKRVTPAKGTNEIFPQFQTLFADSLSHSIISVGLEEMIRGFLTQHHLDAYIETVHASRFNEVYDPTLQSQRIASIQKAVTPFTKNEYLIGIIKGDHSKLNTKILPEERKYNYEKLIVIGDGFSDIAKFSYARNRGGISICVYDPENRKAYERIMHSDLVSRLQYVLPRDYSKDSTTFSILQNIIQQLLSRDLSLNPELLNIYERGNIKLPAIQELVRTQIRADQSLQDFLTLTAVTPDGEICKIPKCSF